jgi:murein DD-endopeptidase MepM/ murein hydrolase activator NlpD
MAKEFFTLIVVPHAKARFRRFNVPVRLAKWTAGVSGGLAIVLGGVFIHYARIAVEVHELRRLRDENKALLSKTLEYEQNAGKLQVKVQYLEGMVTKLGVMAGLEHSLPDAQVGGVGGVPGAELKAPSLDPAALQHMDHNLSLLTDRSSRLEQFFRDQKLLLASTPSIWPVRGYLSAGFGKRIDPFTGQPDFHPGIDISTPQGMKVQAPADGVVIFCGTKGAYGNAVIIDHGYGVMTQYGHLESFVAKPGQRVNRGDVIGLVGSTGRSTAPHLHYEVWVHEQAQNPIHYILDEYRSFG